MYISLVGGIWTAAIPQGNGNPTSNPNSNPPHTKNAEHYRDL